MNNRYAAHEAFGLQSLASLFGAQGGLAEVNFRQVNLTGIDFKRPPATIVDRIPASVFNLASVNATAPPAYLRRCATATNVSLVGMSLTSPPAAIMQCLKRELSDFILENAFTHLVGPNTPPLYVVMGTGDELIPYQNTVAFCEALNAAPLAINPNAIASEFACGTHGKLALLKGANHMLDLGLCVGPICPSGKLGSPLRSAVATTLTSAHAWMKLPDPSNRTGTGGGLAPRVLWSQNFDTNAAGLSPLPAGSMRVANGRLEVSTQNSATEDWPFVWGTREYKLSDRVSFRAEVTTGPQAAGRYVMVGSEGDWNIPVYRRHAVYFDNDTVSASYYDAAFQRVPLGNVLNNMTYVVEVVARPTGTTVYVYEKGKSRASGYSDTRSYSDWGVMGLFIESRSYPGATPVATYVDNLSESVGVP